MKPIARREFLCALTNGAVAAPLLPWCRLGWAAGLPNDVIVTRVVGSVVPTQRCKLVGKNSRLEVHGDHSQDHLLRVYTNADVDGVGYCRASRKAAGQLLGRTVTSLFDAPARFIESPLDSQTMPLWDLVGKMAGKPVYELLGARGARKIPVYDGSIYFADLLPEHSSTWRDRFKQELDFSLASGHAAVKLKIGRGNKWMSRMEGDRRDREVVELIRAHGGNELRIGVDANNGYDLDGAKRLMGDIGEHGIAFVEELFDETVEDCLDFKQHLESLGGDTLLADGETQRDVDAFRPFAEADAIDVYQGDMNSFGIEGVVQAAAIGAPKGIQVAPHNWGSLVGFYHQLQVARGVPNFYMAEHDPLESDVLITDGYRIEKGVATVPDVPGFGLTIDEARFAEISPQFDLKI